MYIHKGDAIKSAGKIEIILELEEVGVGRWKVYTDSGNVYESNKVEEYGERIK